jgi:pyrimidine-nucleoside phosphorylase
MSMDVRAFIRAKRDHGTHTADEVRAFVTECVARRVPDYQLSAWLMAALLNGLDEAETKALTEAMVQSGRRFDWSRLSRPSADKHSTGGVGDKVSLVLAPLVASCGVLVPMVAGRGLGHTGGTVDKLEAIPGFRTGLSSAEMEAQLARIGVVIMAQSSDLAPADGILYAMRDATSTVEFEPFIVSSIVSKKVAEGARALVYDVKCGNGAFMRTREAARRLAERLVRSTRSMGLASSALLTDMNQPIGVAVGNALEVVETVELLHGRGPSDVRALTLDLGARMLVAARSETDLAAARARLERQLDSGAAWSSFVALVEAQGGDAGALERPGGLRAAPVTRVVGAPRSGVVAAIDTYGLGDLSVAIGAGRRSKEDVIDPSVGFLFQVRVGDPVEAGAPLAVLHLGRDDEAAAARLASCVRIDDAPTAPLPRVLEAID